MAEFESQQEAQREQALRNFARRGNDPIVAVGFAQRAAVESVAREFPNLRFVLIDSFVDLPNVQSVLFREEQGSYLAGMMAAMASRSGRVGFIGGMDIPLIRKFACGYVQGARAVNPQIQVFQNMTGSTPAAWRDPVRGGELARSQIERGADVIFAAAGATGIGVLQAAADAGRLGHERHHVGLRDRLPLLDRERHVVVGAAAVPREHEFLARNGPHRRKHPGVDDAARHHLAADHLLALLVEGDRGHR